MFAMLVAVALCADEAFAEQYLSAPSVGLSVVNIPDIVESTDSLMDDQRERSIVDAAGFVSFLIRVRSLKDDLRGRSGVVVLRSPLHGSCANEAGLKTGDLVVKINDRRITDRDDFLASFKDLKIADDIKVEYLQFDDGKGGKSYKSYSSSVTRTAKVPSRKAAIFRELAKDEDRVQGITWVKHFDSPKSNSDTTQATLYFEEKNGKADHLRLVLSVVKKDILIPQSISIRAGEGLYEFPLKPLEAKTLIQVGRAPAAWIDRKVDEKMMEALLAVVQVKSPIIRFGDRNSQVVDFEPGGKGVARLLSVLLGYKLMGGDLDAARLDWLNAEHQKQQAAIAAAVVAVADRPAPMALPAQQPRNAKAVVPQKSDEDLAKERETKAEARLKQAKALREKNASSANDRLREIVTNFPGTKAAAEASRLLGK